MFWKRKGARLLKTLSPYDSLLCHVMTKRSDAQVYFTDYVDCAPIDEYICNGYENSLHFANDTQNQSKLICAFAVKKAYELAEDGDYVLLAGKGHENYQLISGKRVPFSEREILIHEDLLLTKI